MSGIESAVGAGTEEIVSSLLVQLIVILALTRLFVALARRVGQTDVIGEIAAGLVVGPSVLGALAPGLLAGLFPPETATIFVALAQIGLVLLMFQIGLEFELKEHLRAGVRPLVLISGAGIALPFVSGYAAAGWFHARLPEAATTPLAGFRLFFAVALSITAIPVLGRILMDLRLAHTRPAALSIGSAAVNDVIGWLLLGAIALIVREEFSGPVLILRAALLATFTAGVLLLARPLLKRAMARHYARYGRLEPSAIAWILIAIFLAALTTSAIGVFAIIGGFVLGTALHDERRFVDAWRQRVAPLTTTLLLPLFFAYTGLRTDIGALGDARELGICALAILLATATKLGGAYIAARLSGEDPRSALTIGVCMNTRGMMELIALNVGLDLGVLPRSMFTKLVVMALVSTFMATPLIRRLMRGQEQAEEALPAPEAAAAR